jgi:hypothetical protein
MRKTSFAVIEDQDARPPRRSAKPALSAQARTEMLETAVSEAQRILVEHIDPKGISAEEAIDRLLLLLDHREFVGALKTGRGDLDRWIRDYREVVPAA